MSGEKEVLLYTQKRQTAGRRLCLAGDGRGTLRHPLPYGYGRQPLRCPGVSGGLGGGRLYLLPLCRGGCPAVLSAVSRAEVLPGRYTVAYASAIARGRLEVVTDAGERMRAMEVLCRQFDPAAGEKYVACMQASGARTCIVRLSVEEITGKENRG